ncbi:unnamed protein product [Cuscuta epithymum]|uniref:Uncharacterized protein n=1 Tax=Cuscuta epithymum TaxID=186058 RepID=A0AAV0CJE2_9ASTE|nr:unnamed protein product [Cuscuta epithymum]
MADVDILSNSKSANIMAYLFRMSCYNGCGAQASGDGSGGGWRHRSDGDGMDGDAGVGSGGGKGRRWVAMMRQQGCGRRRRGRRGRQEAAHLPARAATGGAVSGEGGGRMCRRLVWLLLHESYF